MEATEFRRLVERHQRMVFSLALRVTGEYGTAEEVAQDAFLELFRAGDGLESEDHVRFWLRRVTARPMRCGAGRCGPRLRPRSGWRSSTDMMARTAMALL